MLPVICRLSVESAGDMARIEQECNSPPWSESLFISEFYNSYSIAWGARSGGKLVGYIVCHSIMEEAHIVTFGVSSECRGLGFGKKLLLSLLRELARQGVRSVTLEVRQSNTVARALYEKVGFSEVSLRKAYYTDNHEDALVLRLDMEQFIHEWGKGE